MEVKPIITKTCGKYFLWNEQDVMTLRKKHRVCGVTVGSLPRKPWQNSFFSLPLLLMPVEVKLCLVRGLATLKSPDVGIVVKERKIEINAENEERLKQEDEQIRIFKREKLEKSKLYYGRKKLKKDARQWQQMCDQDMAQFRRENPKEEDCTQTDCTKEIVECEEVRCEEITEKEKNYYHYSIRVHIPTCSQSKQLRHLEDISLKDLSFTNREQLFYTVYEDLWMKGYFITSAEKFGGDFLVYPGDPLRFHSKFIVVVMETCDEMTSQQLVVYGRLGSAVKKTVVLGSVDYKGEVQYISLSWKNF